MLIGGLMTRQRNQWTGHAMAVGDAGALYYSNNGKSWSDRRWNNGRHNREITARPASNGAGTILLPLESGTIFISTDGGTTWSQLTGHPFTTNIEGCAYINGRWYISDGGSDVRWSTDLVTWTPCTWTGGAPDIDETDAIFCFDMAYDPVGGVYVMFASRTSSGSAYLYSSTNGTDFTRRQTIGLSKRGAVAFGNGNFACVAHDGIIYQSTDGVTWNLRTPAGGVSPDFTSIVYNSSASLFMAVGGFTTEGVQTSPDGITWTQRAVPGDLTMVSHVTSTWVVVGWNGTTYQAWTSTNNGDSWTSRAFATASGGAMTNILYDSFSSKFYAFGPNPTSGADLLHMQVSSDSGASWTKTYITGTSMNSNCDFTGIATNESGRWVAVGPNGIIIYSDNNGSSWTLVNTGTIENLYAVAYHASMTPKWVAVGMNGITLTSNDGASWTLSTGATTMDLVDVACNGTIWAAADESGQVWTSTNGSTWTARTLSTTNFTPAVCTAIAWNGSVFCVPAMSASYANLEAQTSPDGITWTSRNNPAAGGSNNRLFNMSWADGKFRAYSYSGGNLYTSADGITWAEDFGTYSFNLDDLGIGDHSQCLAYSQTSGGSKMFILAIGNTALSSSVLWSLDGIAVSFATGVPTGVYIQAVHAYTTA